MFCHAVNGRGGERLACDMIVRLDVPNALHAVAARSGAGSVLREESECHMAVSEQ